MHSTLSCPHPRQAIQQNDISMLERLLSAPDAAAMCPRLPTGQTALHFAAAEQNSRAVLLLLSRGFGVNELDRGRHTPLHYACRRPLADTVRVLLEAGAVADARALDGSTPLHVAVEAGSSEVVRLLLAKGANRSYKLQNGATALHVACAKGLEDVCRALLLGVEKPALLINLPDMTGSTALHAAAAVGSCGVVALLLEKGADIRAKAKVSDVLSR